MDVKAAVAGEQKLKGECNSLRLAVDAARQAVAAKDAECMRLQQSLHSSRCELAELAAKHRYAGECACRNCYPDTHELRECRVIGACPEAPSLSVHNTIVL